MNTLVEISDLRKDYPLGTTKITAVDGVSLSIRRGEALGLVGESGSGKSTLGRMLVRLADPTSGSIRFEGTEITGLSQRALRPLRRHMQLVFQDPYASLNPRMTVEQILDAALRFQLTELTSEQRRSRMAEVLDLVGLSAGQASRYPHQFSGGQRQRIAIARAIIAKPAFLVADEPVSALDVSIQAQIINLFLEIKRELDVTILFITHDLAVVGYVCDRVAVMNRGRIVEIADKQNLFNNPQDPYTRLLIASSPVPDPRRRRKG